MRLANYENNYWQLRSGEELNRQNPEAFWIPPLEQRQNLQRGQAARLIFDIEGQDEDGEISVQGERMWVIVAEKIDEIYIGVLDNQPASIERSDKIYLRFGAEIPFCSEHVIDIAQPPADYVEWQLGQPPARIWPRDV